ncbi:MAG: heavy metal translocating P-type ATPase [Lachnospiraceae bacterium]|nr:heavy metal translocating P-type ATPase [Lachnospiraceae bacterium]
MEQYTVTGMSCAACQARVEKAVSALPGVESCAVSLLTGAMGVEGSVDPSAVISAVEKAGYGASLKDTGNASGPSADYLQKLSAQEDALKDRETPALRKRLLTSLGFLLLLLYVSMGAGMFGFPLPAFLADNPVSIGLLQLLLSTIILVINRRFFVSGFRALLHRAPNMDSLIALGSGTGYVYSVVILFLMSDALLQGKMHTAHGYVHELYFEASAMILTLITLGKMLEAYSKGKTTDALKSLMRLTPKTATVLRNGQEVSVSVSDLRVGDLFLVRPGETIPVDGIVREGTSAVNEAALTGESIPVDKEPGAEVTSATLNQSGFLKCEATRVGEDTTLAKIISMVSDAAATKAPVARLADRISGIFVPAVILIAIVTFVIWLLLGAETGYALARGITVLVVSCPCALGLATPVSIMVGNGVGARSGILFKTAESLQETGNIRIVALDKTGTVTEGIPRVTDLVPAEGVTEEELLRKAAALERPSEHPLAGAVLRYAESEGLIPEPVEDFLAKPGNGLQARLKGNLLVGGNAAFAESFAPLPMHLLQESRRLSGEGKTPLFFLENDTPIGLIAVADTLRPDSAEAIRQLQRQGITVVMLTGDNERTAAAIGARAGVDRVIAGVLPDGKEAVIRELKASGKVAMVGDGINDAPALTQADLGIAVGAGTDVAIDAADVVLMKSRMADVPAAVRLSRATYRNIMENLFWALIYNTLLIPAAAGLYSHFGVTMNPMLGAAAMSLSSFCVVSNALRLNLVKVYDPSRDRNPYRETPEEKRNEKPLEKTLENKEGSSTMEKTIEIKGMMCAHCEASVKKALESLEGVESAQVSHEKGTAVVTLGSDVADDILKKAVEEKDYEVTGIH